MWWKPPHKWSGHIHTPLWGGRKTKSRRNAERFFINQRIKALQISKQRLFSTRSPYSLCANCKVGNTRENRYCREERRLFSGSLPCNMKRDGLKWQKWTQCPPMRIVGCFPQSANGPVENIPITLGMEKDVNFMRTRDVQMGDALSHTKQTHPAICFLRRHGRVPCKPQSKRPSPTSYT